MGCLSHRASPFLLAASILVLSSPAVAQSAATDTPAQPGQLSDIIVTATRQSTNIQNVPIAITAVSGDSLKQRNLVDPRQLGSLAPSLYIDQGAGNGETHVGIRGLNSIDFSLGGSSPVAIYIDDVYQPFQFGLGTQIFDLDRIEVLRGPQGTLFGKNTTGGALLYYSQAPSNRTEGYFQVDGGSGAQDHFAVEGGFNRPLSDTLAMRVSFRADHRGDYVRDLLSGGGLGRSTSISGRVQFRWQPSKDTSATLKLYALNNDGHPTIGISKYIGNPCASPAAPYYLCDANGVPTPASPTKTSVYESVAVFERFHNYGAILKVDQKLGDFALTSITAGQAGRYASKTGDTASAGDYFHTVQQSKSWQVSQELRLATPQEKPLRAVIGAFAMYDHINVQAGSGSTLIDPSLDYAGLGKGVQGTTTLAVFGNATYDINQVFSVIGGLRYSSEHKSIRDRFAALNGFNSVDFTARDLTDADLIYDQALAHFPNSATGDAYNDVLEANNDSHTWRRLTWDATLNAKLRPDLLLYAKAATGFRSGGYQVARSTANTFNRLNPERVNSYEVGFKSEFFNRTLRLNGSAYYMKYKDQVVQISIPVGVGTVLQNAGESISKGVDLEITALPVRGLTLSGSVGYNHARYTRYFDPILNLNLAGNHLPTAPDWTANGGINYSIPIGDYDLMFNTDWNYRSKIFFTSYNYDIAIDKPRATGNVKVTFANRPNRWSISAYVNNVTNTLSKGLTFYVFFDGHNGFTNTTYVPGRTWGLQTSLSF